MRKSYFLRIGNFMKHHKLLLIFLLLPGILFAQPARETQQSQSRQYVLEKQRTVPSSVQSWIFGARAQIAVEQKQITWFDAPVIRKVPLTHTYLRTIHSRGERFFGILSLQTVSQDPREPKVLRLEVYSALQEKLFTLERKQGYDDPYPVIAISDRDGAVVLGQVTNAELFFYDHGGKLQKQVKLFPQVEYDLERTLLIDLSADGSTVAVVASERGIQPPGGSNGTRLFLFGANGERLLEKPLDDEVVHSMTLSPDAQIVATACYTISPQGVNGRALLFNRAGKEIFRTDLLFKQARFSPDNRAILLFNNREARVINLENRTISYQYTISASQGMIAAAELSREGRHTVLLLARSEFRTNAFIFTQPIVRILNRQGELLSEINLKEQTFRTPALTISEDAKEILIGFEQGYQIYRVK